MALAQPNTLELLWNEMLEKHLVAVNNAGLNIDRFQGLDYHAFQVTLRQLDQHTRNRRLIRCLERLQPNLQHLQIFTAAITSLVQGKADPASFIWGSIQMVLGAALHFVSTLDLITEMLDDLTTTLNRFNRYITILGNNIILQKYLLHLYDAYVGFCVSVMQFYKSCRWYTIVKLMWKTVKESFEASRKTINKHIENFLVEARISIDELTVRGFNDLNTRAHQRSLIQGSLRTAYCVPFSRNEFFVGRTEELERLHQRLARSESDGSQKRYVCVNHSMGGLGKTQLALEYSYKYRAEYEMIFWLAAEHEAELAQDFAKIATSVCHDWEAENLVKKVQSAKLWLENTTKNWLLIYDNVESWETLRPYWPSGANGSILITSQRIELVQIAGGLEIALQPLEESDGATLLLKQLRWSNPANEDRKKAEMISRTLGGMPLAISHMAGFIDQSKSTLSEFSEVYEQRQQSRRVWSQSYGAYAYQYDGSLRTVWDIALKELPRQSLTLLNKLSMLNPDRVPEAMLFGESSDHTLSRELLMSLANRQLVRRQVHCGGAFWSIHRALKLNILHNLDSNIDLRQTTFWDTVSLVRRVYPRQSEIQAPTNDNWQANEAYLPHVLQLQEIFQDSSPPIKPPAEFAELLSDAGNYMWERALFEQGIKSLELAEQLYDTQSWGALLEHSKVSTLLGVISQEMGLRGRRRGLELCIKSLKLRRQSFHNMRSSQTVPSPSEYLLLANAWNDLACSMLEYSCFKQAEAYLQISLDIKRQQGFTEVGEAFFNYAENYKNLAIVKIADEKLEDAVRLTTQAVKLMENKSNSNSATVLSFRFHRAYALFYAEQLDSALQEHEAVRKGRIETFGDYEVHTLNSYYACGVALQAMGRFEEAKELLELYPPIESPTKAILESLARTKRRQALILSQMACPPSDVGALFEEANMLRAQVEQAGNALLTYEYITGDTESDERLTVEFDHLVSFEAGRTTIGCLRLESIDVDLD